MSCRIALASASTSSAGTSSPVSPSVMRLQMTEGRGGHDRAQRQLGLDDGVAERLAQRRGDHDVGPGQDRPDR